MIPVIGNFSLLSISLLISLAVAELGARILHDPVDYLNPTIVTDELLSHRIERDTGGHDALGFRNLEALVTADIVCIGDSMTYGVSARARESWPAVLGSIRGDKVYNMSLGGYGPIQYLHLMRTHAIEFRPKIVLIGFYFGNDFLDTYNMVRFNTNWRGYAIVDGPEIQSPPFILPRQPGKFLASLRDWLSRNSVLYALITQSSLFDFVRRQETLSRMSDNNNNLIMYRDDKHNVFFDLNPRVRFLDMNDNRIKLAVEIAKRTMLDMQNVSKKHNIRLIVTLIPTKERVYGKLLTQAGYREQNWRLMDALEQEDIARKEITGFLHEHDIEVIDLLRRLEVEVVNRDLYPITDEHPNAAGYRFIAETINLYLNDTKLVPNSRKPDS